MEQIKDLEIYNARMAKSMYDKLWFVDKLPDDISMLYDYGCGDGTLLQMAQPFLPNGCLTRGYDNNFDMVVKARRKLGYNISYQPLTEVPAGTCLVASSVFHEIYNYSEDIEAELQNIFGIGADYIAIRDMYYDNGNVPNRKSMFFQEAAVRRAFQGDKKVQLDQFEETWGSIAEEKNLVHFLLKYRYVENWSRELKENYLPYQIYDIIPDTYQFIYYETYTLPFLKAQIKKDFGVTLEARTHYKMLLKRVK